MHIHMHVYESTARFKISSHMEIIKNFIKFTHLQFKLHTPYDLYIMYIIFKYAIIM